MAEHGVNRRTENSPGRTCALFVRGRTSAIFFILGGNIMEFTEILTAISTVGFPIVFCLILFWYLREESNNHKTEMDQLKDVIAENNTILASLKQLIQDKLKEVD